jgi:hypothetical protein
VKTRILSTVTVAVVLAIGLPVERAVAAPVFHVQGAVSGFAFDRSSGTALSDGLHFGGPTGSLGNPGDYQTSVFCAAGPGGVQARAHSRLWNMAGAALDPNGQADLTLDDVVVSGPAGPVMVSYNLQLSGLLEGSATLLSAYTASAARVAVRMSANGSLLNDEVAVKYNDLPQRGTPQLVNFAGSTTLTTVNFTVQANQPFTVQFLLSVDAQVGLNLVDGELADATSAFFDTLTFASGPVFNLPAGYTADSPSGGVVGNVFVLPEPTLLGIPMLALVLGRRPRRGLRGLGK